MKLQYDFKAVQEAIWFGLVAAVVVVGEMLVTLEPADVLTNWQTYAIAIGAAAARAFVAVVLRRMPL